MITLQRLSLAALTAAIVSPAAFAAEGEPLLLNSTHWTFLVLVLFLLLIWKLGAFKGIGNSLDSRANEIQRELDHAQELREEASALLSEAERKQQDASEQAEAIIRQAEKDAKSLMAQAEKDLQAMVARREAQVEARIARAGDEAIEAVKKIAADAATRAAGDIVRSDAEKNGATAFSKALGQVKSAL